MQPGKQAMGDEYVETDGGVLIHCVSDLFYHCISCIGYGIVYTGRTR